MDSVFNLIFDMFGQVINWLKLIPVWNNVSLFDFSIVILIMSIVIVAFVNIVPVGSTNYVNDTLKAERQAQERMQNELYKNSYLNYRSNRMRNEKFKQMYNEEKGNGFI